MSASLTLAALVMGGGISYFPDAWQLMQRLHEDSPEVHEEVCALIVADPGQPVEGHLWRLYLWTGHYAGKPTLHREVALRLPAWFVNELRKRLSSG